MRHRVANKVSLVRYIIPMDSSGSYSIFTRPRLIWMIVRLRSRSASDIYSHYYYMVSLARLPPNLLVHGSYVVNRCLGVYSAAFAASIFYLVKKRHTSRTTMTKLIALANILMFLLATAVSTYPMPRVLAPSAGIVATANGYHIENGTTSCHRLFPRRLYSYSPCY